MTLRSLFLTATLTAGLSALALAAVLRVVDAMPAGVSDWMVRRMRFRIRPE